MKNILLLFIGLSYFACTTTSYVESVEQAHQKSAFLDKEAIQFDLVLTFGGRERYNGTITLLTNTTKALLEYNDGKKIYVNEDQIFYSPEFERPAAVRFTAYTWTYFFALPYKLSDPGTAWSDFPLDTLAGNAFESRKLTFEANIGDAPEDWYITYQNPETKLIDIAAYIATAGGSKEEAEEDPHAIEYLDYHNIDGIPLAHEWIFWEWRETGGLTRKLGNASLSNFHFVQPEKGFFDAPESFTKG